MPLCGAKGCLSSTADLKCARCQGEFYCNATCQKADWKRHKPYCKPLPSSSSESPPARQLQRGPVLASQADFELFEMVHSFLVAVNTTPKFLKKGLPSVLARIQSLLSRGARPDVLMIDGRTSMNCLSAVCKLGFPGVEGLLELLLATDATPPVDPNLASDLGSGALGSPMYHAIIQHRPSFIRLLVAHGTDLQAPCCQIPAGQLQWPVERCVTDVLCDLDERRPVDGALETLDCLLSAGFDVDACDARWIGDEPPSNTALMTTLIWPCLVAASEPARKALAIKLIDAGANVHARDHKQARPLDLAARLSSLDVFKALIAKGADPSPTPYIGALAPGQDRQGYQVGTHYLHDATVEGRVDVLQAAAAAGVNLKKVKALGAVAAPLLAEAVAFGHPNCVRFLLDYGVDVNEVYVDARGRARITACDVLCALGPAKSAESVSRMLRAAGGKCYDEL